MKVFIYETLKNKHTLMKALHEKKAPQLKPATLPGYMETWITKGGDKWPTLRFIGSKGDVEGDILDLSTDEAVDLDRWENRYKRTLVNTDKGHAYAYIYSGGE